MIYVCLALALVAFNVFWIFVVIMLLNTKSILIATKQLVCSFVPKTTSLGPQPAESFGGVGEMIFNSCCT